MTDNDMIPVPRELIEDLLEHSLSDRAHTELQYVYDHASQPAPRLRVVNLDVERQITAPTWGECIPVSDLQALPDPMTVIEQAAMDRPRLPHNETAAVMEAVSRIRAALIGAAK